MCCVACPGRIVWLTGSLSVLGAGTEWYARLFLCGVAFCLLGSRELSFVLRLHLNMFYAHYLVAWSFPSHVHCQFAVEHNGVIIR